MKPKLNYLFIPDAIPKEKKKRFRAAEKTLRKRNVDNVLILGGHDSEEDILIIGKMIKKGQRIGIVTFHLHFLEYLEIIKKAIRDKKFPKEVSIENIKTRENFHLKIYGILGLLEEKLKHRKLKYFKNRHEKLLNKLKKIVHEVV